MINKSGLQRDTYIFKYMTKLSPHTYQLIEKLFPTVEQADVTRWLLEECGQNLPFQKDTDEYGLERIRFAALKLLEAIELAKRDWRDLLMGRLWLLAQRTRRMGKGNFREVQIITMFRKGFDL